MAATPDSSEARARSAALVGFVALLALGGAYAGYQAWRVHERTHGGAGDTDMMHAAFRTVGRQP